MTFASFSIVGAFSVIANLRMDLFEAQGTYPALTRSQITPHTAWPGDHGHAQRSASPVGGSTILHNVDLYVVC